MKRRRDEESELDAVEIKKLKKKHKRSSHHYKNEVPVCSEEKIKPLDLMEYRSDVSKMSTKHNASGFELTEMDLNDNIRKTKKKHEVSEKNTPEKQEKDTNDHLFKEEFKKHAISDLGFSETNKQDTIIKKPKKKHKTKEADSSDESKLNNLGVLVDSDLKSCYTSESDRNGIKKKKKHKHDKDSRIFQENIHAESSSVADIKKDKKKKKKNKDKNKQVDYHIPVTGEATADPEPNKEISENKQSLEENFQLNGDETCSKRSKKKMKSKGKALKQKSDSESQTNALEYLRQWQSDGENWKFQKVRQVWLLHNVYNKDKIGEKDFDILLRYLEPLRGRAREKTLSEAEEIMKSYESKEEADMDEEKLLKVQRARQVIQILSIEPGQAFVTLPLSIYSRKMIFKYLHLHGTVLKQMAERLNVEVNMARKQFGFDEKEAKYMFAAQMNKLKKDLYIKHNCHPFKATAVVWFQLPVWICLSLSLRNLSGASLLEAGHIHPDMMHGGLLWFSDLTQFDPTYIVPAIAFLLYLANIEMSYLQHLKLPRLQNILIYIFRGLSIFVLCIGCQLPSCVPYYWMVSSGIGLVQNLLLMSPNFKKKLKIPSFPHESETPYLDLIKHAKIKYLGRTTEKK
ncbi:hypothetical protein ACJMK2_033555 [Sinanodonta woodiana]|uniref:Uncharacterized protein n=1 Tax=Sinanodonta woodiana TaxID=1069815 RepID=A0ABD3WSH2_SINWO